MLFELKKGVKLEDITELSPALLPVFTFVVLYCHTHKLPCRITSLINDRDKVHAISRTHAEGRAFDLGIEGIPGFHVKRLAYHANLQFREIAAIGFDSGKPEAAVDKAHGTGPHIHFQVRPDAPFHQYLKLD